MESASAIQVAADNTSPGDVILIEQQSAGPRWPGGKSQFGYLPLEWQPAVRTAIQSATARGRIVVEAAGNGSQDLDDPIYGGWFATDSGAILVGAGNAPGCRYGNDPTVARGRLSFSNYGSRTDLQGWGNCVVSSGYGDLQPSSGGNVAYTAVFGGTSSASPIVASSAAALSSVAESRGTTLTPATVRTMLEPPVSRRRSGTPARSDHCRTCARRSGRSARSRRGDPRGQLPQLQGTTVPVRETWTSSGSAAVRYEVWLSTDGGTFVKQGPTTAAATFNLERNHSYQFVARAVDAAGIWGDWAYGTAFRVDAYQENFSAGTPGSPGAGPDRRGSRRRTAS